MLSMNSYAEKRIFIEDFEINPGESLELIVKAECDVAWGGYQFRIKAPEGLSFVDVAKNRPAVAITDEYDPDWMAFTRKVLTTDNADTPTMDDTGALSVVAGGIQGDELPIGEVTDIVKCKIEASDTFDPSAGGKLQMYNMKISDDKGSTSFRLDDLFVATDVIETLAGDKAVKSVKYVNMLGVESNEPFDGVNVVVTTYQDGTKASQKVVK